MCGAGTNSLRITGQVGDAAVAEAALKAPETPKDHWDDRTCPNPVHKRSDCGGKGEVCMTKDSGCRCQEQSCPKPKLTCDDTKCKGNNGKQNPIYYLRACRD